MIRRHQELRSIETFEDRFNYLALRGIVGEETFGYDRWMNQAFYRSKEWRSIRHHVIARDLGCDLGLTGYEIHDRVYIHHMNPMTMNQIRDGDPDILNPEYLITVTHDTHNAIHYGDAGLLRQPFVERSPGDTTLWKRSK